MTKGIDTGTSQAGINFAAVAQAGYDFVIVKAGGFNAKPEYVAPHYHEQIDGAKAAGLHRGHYWIVGAGDPIQEADFFAAHLYNLDKNHDVLVLDDERLDSNATFWTDGDVAKFFTELHKKTGVPYKRLWFYIGAFDARSHDWALTKGLGVRTWIASYGKDDGTIVAPSLDGKLPCDVQQYTQNGHVAGYQVDLSYSKRTAADLFDLTVPAPTPLPAPVPAVVPAPAPVVTVKKPGRSVATVATGIPNGAFRQRLQWFAHLNGYAGPIDGTLGLASWIGVQRGLKRFGYTGPLDGIPGVRTYMALQTFARKFGYAGPIDGKLGAKSYIALAKGLNSL